MTFTSTTSISGNWIQTLGTWQGNWRMYVTASSPAGLTMTMRYWIGLPGQPASRMSWLRNFNGTYQIPLACPECGLSWGSVPTPPDGAGAFWWDVEATDNLGGTAHTNPSHVPNVNLDNHGTPSFVPTGIQGQPKAFWGAPSVASGICSAQAGAIAGTSFTGTLSPIPNNATSYSFSAPHGQTWTVRVKLTSCVGGSDQEDAQVNT